MPLKLSVGFSKKMGLPDYGSLGASCGVELELEHAVFERVPEHFQAQVRLAYAACTQAVLDELARQRDSHDAQRLTNGALASFPANGRNVSPRRATAAQLRALRAIAASRGIDLEATVAERFDSVRPDELSVADASLLIDEFNAGKRECAKRE